MKILLELGTVLGRFLSKLRILSVKSRSGGAKKKLTATIDRREVALGHKTLHARRFGIGRCQKPTECYVTVSKATGEKSRRHTPIQNVPIRPKQPSSILVDTGFMFLRTLNAELDKRVKPSFEACGDTEHAQYENDGKGCRGYENCEWYKTSCQKESVVGRWTQQPRK